LFDKNPILFEEDRIMILSLQRYLTRDNVGYATSITFTKIAIIV